MFFALCVGRKIQTEAWRQLAESHARWLGLSTLSETRELGNGETLILSVVVPPEAAGSSPCVDEAGVIKIASSMRLVNRIHLNITVATGLIDGVAPPATPEQCYFAMHHGCRVVGNDMRWMVQWTGMDLDEVAVYSLLQYGCIPPPYTLSKSLQRLGCGHRLTWLPDRLPAVKLQFSAMETVDRSLDAEVSVERTLDNILQPIPRRPALFFSGGVDSTLLALRLKKLQRDDVRLINYSFGPDDGEAAHALRVADQMGTNCTQIRHDESHVGGFFDRIARDYAFPFADFSSIPTNLLVHAAVGSCDAGTFVIEGTGADGAFDFGPKYSGWQRLMTAPRLLRSAASALYSAMGYWRNDSSGRGETLGRLCRRSVQMPMHHAIVAQNPLDGISYRVPADIRDKMEDAIRCNVEDICAAVSPVSQLSILDLVVVCAAQFAAKSFDPLRHAGFHPIYPFLEESMVDLSLKIPWDIKCEGGKSKALLKRITAKSIPHEMVYRRKSGFKPPIHLIFAQQGVQGVIRENVLSSSNPILAYVDLATTTRMFERVSQGLPVSHGTYSYLWALLFLSVWHKQLPRRHDQN